MITLYSKPSCPHCSLAKAFLERHQIPFTVVDVTADAGALRFIKEERGHKSVPQIYVGTALLVEGGNAGLQKLSPEEINRRIGVILG